MGIIGKKLGTIYFASEVYLVLYIFDKSLSDLTFA